MGNENLTRAEAAERAKRLRVHSYTIDLDLTGDTTFGSRTTVVFDCNTPGWSTFIDLIAPTVVEATLNGTAIDVASNFDGARLTLPELADTNELVVTANCLFMNTGEGLHKFVDPVDNETYLYTQFEVADARRVFACFDQPDLKSVYTFSMTTPAHWTVTSITATPEPTTTDAGHARWEFATSEKMSTYITSLVAGPYSVFTDHLTSCDGRTINMKLLCRPSLAEYFDTENIFSLTKAGFEFFESAFAQPYPFSKYDQIFVPEFNAGAMENSGNVTYRDAYVFRSKETDAVYERRALTILHELAHMWFGNLVTMRWWDDLWLNESFAEWASTTAMIRATEWTNSWTTFAIHEKNWAYKQDQLPSTHPIVADMVDLDAVGVNFDGITYAKGASTLKHLVHYVGEEAFMAGLVAYFDKHKWGNTEAQDLLDELTIASGRDLSDWSRRWLNHAGVNTISPEMTLDDDGNIASFTITQSAADNYPTLRPHRLVIGGYTLDGDTLTRTLRLEVDIDGEATAISEMVGKPRPDLLLLNDDDYTYAKVRLDTESLEVATKHLTGITDPLARVAILTSLWDMTRDGEFPAHQMVNLILDNLAHETSSPTNAVTLGQLTTLVSSYVHPDRRSQVREHAASTLLTLATAAEAGSDAQLQLVRNFAYHACIREHVDRVAAILDGSQPFEGLIVDTDLRWDLVKSLATAGRISAADIDAELAADTTAKGMLAAHTAHAARPDNKQATWDLLMATDDLANDTQLAVITGFNRAHDTALLEPFVAPYFDNNERIWANRTQEMAGQITNGLYPISQASPELLERTEKYLAEHQEMTSAGRRQMTEQADAAARALRVQEADRLA